MSPANQDGVLPPGDAAQKALRWISERRRDNPKASVVQLVDEASLRFDLTPNQAEALLRMLKSGG
jgi:hypothetical protein